MEFNNDLIVGKLRRWEKWILNYRLPDWDQIPDIGLYMVQVIDLMHQYVNYLPPEPKEEQPITPATINNYVRTKVMPEPVKKRYYRVHLVYLLIILTLKSNLSIAMISRMLPVGLTEEELKRFYLEFKRHHELSAQLFLDQIRRLSETILDPDAEGGLMSLRNTEDLVITSAIIGVFSKILTQKLLLLDGKTLENGGSIDLE